MGECHIRLSTLAFVQCPAFESTPRAQGISETTKYRQNIDKINSNLRKTRLLRISVMEVSLQTEPIHFPVKCQH